jgi:transcriptional regulator with XRE-family HTH domain
MQTVGNLIKEARFRKGYSRQKLGELTHIKTNFITAIETANWEELPDFNIVLGFVKVITHFLNINELQAVSIFRREYPTSILSSRRLVVHQGLKGIGKRFIWGPRFTFLAGVLIVILVVLFYLGFQYKKFSAPPTLLIIEPKESQIISSNTLQVNGKTDPDVTITVNNQPVIVNSDGSFSDQIDVNKNMTEIKIIAKSRSGKETVVTRRIDTRL